VAAPKTLATDGNMRLIRYYTLDALWLELIVNKEDGSEFRSVIHIYEPARFVEHYIELRDQSGATRRQSMKGKVVSRKKFEEILEKAMNLQRFGEFAGLEHLIRHL